MIIRNAWAFAALALLAFTPGTAQAVDIIKADTTTMNVAADWGGTAPSSANLGIFDGTISLANEAALTLGGAVALQGMQFNNTLNGDVSVANTGGFTLSLSGSGIDMSAANKNVTLNCLTALAAAQTWKVNTGQQLKLNGALSGAFALTIGSVTATGTVELNETSTRTTAAGSTTLAGGTLILDQGNALNTLNTAALTFNNGTLQLNSTANTTFNGTATTLGGNVYVVGNINNSGVGATATLRTLSIGAFTLNARVGSGVTSGTAGITYGTTTLTGNAIFDVANGVNLTLGSLTQSTGAKTITKQGLGTLTLGTAANALFTGSTITLSAGTLIANLAGALSAVPTTANTTTVTVNGGELRGTVTGSFRSSGTGTPSEAITLSGGTVRLYNSAATTFGGNLTYSSGSLILDRNTSGGTLAQTMNSLTIGSVTLAPTRANYTAAPTLTFGSTAITGNATLDSANVIFSLGTLSIGGNTLTTQGANTLTAGATTLNGAATFSIGATAPLTVGAITGGANALTLKGAGNFAQTGVWAGSGSSLVLDSTYSGTATLNQANTFTGPTTVTAGTLALGNASALGTTPGVDGTSGISMAAGTVLSSITVGGSTIAAPITLDGVGNTTLRVGQGAASTTHTFTLNGAIGGATANLVYTTTTGSFANGTSLFVLGAAGTYTGNTLITTGNGGNNPVTVRNGVVNALPVTTVLSFGQVAGGGTGRNFQYDLNGNDQTLAGLDNGGLVPQVRRMIVTSATSSTLTINNAANCIFGGSTISTSVGTIGSLTRAQIIGAIALTKSGTGTFTLGGTLAGGATPGGHTFTGDTKILGGILVLGETLSIQNSVLDTAASVLGDANNGLRTTVTTLTLGGLTGNKNLADVFTTTTGGYTGLTGLTLNPGTGATPSYAAIIADGAPGMTLTKTGVGTQTLAGANTYSGSTTINTGTLALGASGSLAAGSSVSIASGATFDVSAIASYSWGASAALTASGTASTPAILTAGTTVDLGTRPVTLNYTPDSFAGDADSAALSISAGTLALNSAMTVVNNGASPLGNGTYVLIKAGNASTTGTPTLNGSVGGQGIEALKVASIQRNVTTGDIELLVQDGLTPTIALTRASGTVDNSTYGAALQFDVSVTGSGATPAGTVELREGSLSGTLLGSGALAGGTVTISPALNALIAGTHTLFAVYSGGAPYLPGNNTLSQTVQPLSVTVSGASASSKMFDNTTLATITGGTVSTVVSGDTAVEINADGGTFANVGPGLGISVTVILGGTKASSYSLSSANATTADILTTATWTATSTPQPWDTAANWLNSVVGTGSGNTANFNTVDLLADTTVNLTSPRTIGNLVFGDTETSTTPASWTLAGTAPNTLTLAGTTPTVTVNALGTGKSTTLSAVVDGTAGLTKAGVGTLALTGANTYSGGLAVTDGTVTLGNATAAGTGTITLDTAGAVNASVLASAAITIANPIVIASGSAGVNTLGNSGNVNVTYNGGITANNNLTISNGGTAMLTHSGIISGNGGVTTAGSALGTTVFGGASTYTGGFTLGGTSIIVPSTSSTGTDGDPTDGPFGAGTTPMVLSTGTMRATTGGDITIKNVLTLAGNLAVPTYASEKSLIFSGPATLTSTRTFAVDVGTTVTGKSLTFSGAIAESGGSFGITKEGTGALILSGANSYTGPTTINSGTLKLGASNVLPDTTPVSIGGATLDADIQTDTAGTLAVIGAATINLGTGAQLAFADSSGVAWTGHLTLTGTLGATSLRFGTSATGLTADQLARITVNGNGVKLDADGYLVEVAASTYNWDNDGDTVGFGMATGTWAAPTTGNASQGWSIDPTGATLPGDVTTTWSDSVSFGTASAGLAAGTITVSGTVAAKNLTFGSASDAITLSGGTILLASSPTLTVNNSVNTINTTLSGAAASLTKAGSGTLVLAEANTYSGVTTISAGTLRITHASALGNTAGRTTQSGTSELAIDGTGGAVIVGAEALTINGGGISNAGALRNIVGDNTYGGTVTMAAQSRINSDSGTLTLNNATAVTGAAKNLVVGGAGNITISGAITTGSGSVNKADGVGTLTLSGLSATAANNYSGTTTIGAGTLAFTTTEPSLTGGLTFGAAATTTTSGILDLTSTSATFGGAMGVNVNSATASEIKIGAARTLTLNNNVRIGATTPVTGSSTVTKLSLTGGGTFNVTTPAAGTFYVGGSTLTSTSTSQDTTLDLTALSQTTINVSDTGTLRVNPASSSNVKGYKSTLLLPTPAVADTVAIATLTAGTISVGAGSTFNGGEGQVNTLQLGAGLTTLNANTINVGTGSRDLGHLIFGQATGDLKIRAADGSSRATAINIGTGGAATGTTHPTTITLVDFSGHDADIFVTSLNVGNQARVGNLTTEFKFGAGDSSLASKLDATSVKIGFRTGTATTTSILTDRVYLSGGTVLFGDAGGAGAGVDIGNSTYNADGAAGTVGELNISGGAVTLYNSTALGAAVRLGSNVTAGGGTVTASLNLTGGTTTLGGDIIRGATSPRTTSTVTLSGGTLDMGGNDIGAAGSAITLTVEAGTLMNVATINGTDGLTKTTAGTLTLSGVNTYSGSTTISAGTLALGVADALPATAVSIGAGTLDAQTFTNTVGSLAITAGATINLGAGAALAFADSSELTWAGTLNITGTFVSGSSLKFGTGNTALTSTQLSQISSFGFSGFGLNESGYLTATTTPAIGIAGTLSALSTTYGTASSTASFTVSGAYLTPAAGDLTVTPPSGYEVSLSSGSGYTTSLLVPYGSATLASTTVYIRLTATAGAASYSGDISVSGGGAPSQTLPTVSSTVNPKALTIGAPTVTRAYNGLTTAGTVTVGTLSGFVGSETVTATGTATAYSAKDVGAAYASTVSYVLANGTGGGLAANYTLADSVIANAAITPALLTVTADNARRAVGEANPTFTYTITGYQPGEDATSANVTGAPSLSTTADTASPAGTYTITCEANNLAAPNYTFSYVNGTLTVYSKGTTIRFLN